jgi:hypothetical protein
MEPLRIAWSEFVRDVSDRLARAADEILDAPLSELDRVEGIRALLRDTRKSIERGIENVDRDFPFFSEIYSDTYHLVGDTPDYTIHAAVLEPNGVYVIRGVTGMSASFNFTTQGPRPGSPDGGVMMSLVHRNAESVITGTLDDTDITIDDRGRFEIQVSRDRPLSGDWLPMGETTSLLLVRNEFHGRYPDHLRWSPTKLQIERIGSPVRPDPLDPARLAAALREVAAEIGAATLGRREISRGIQRRGDGKLSFDPTRWRAGGGNPRTVFAAGSWALDRDQALVLDLDRVPESAFWVVLLTNAWMETLDFRFGPVSLNRSTASVQGNGGLRLVVAHDDPGVPNWLDTAGHDNGTIVWRWNYPQDSLPAPRTRVVPISQVANLGPIDV